LVASGGSVDLIAVAQDRINDREARYRELNKLITAHRLETMKHEDIRAALHQFDDMWDAMPGKERCRFVELLVRTVNYDGVAGNIDITFHPTNIESLGQEPAETELFETEPHS